MPGPGGSLIAVLDSFRTEFLRTRDGALLNPWGASAGQLDPTWTRSLDLGPASAVTVRDVRTGQVLVEFAAPSPPEPNGWFAESTALFAGGDRVLAMDCWENPSTSASRAVLRVLEIASGLTHSLSLDQPCDPLEMAPLLVRDEIHDRVLAVGLGGGAISAVDLATGQVRTASTHVGRSASMCCFAPDRTVLATALSPDGGSLALTGHDGVLRLFDGDSLASRPIQLVVGLPVANGNTYLPSTESPVAFSPDGTLLAFIDPSGRVVLHRISDGATLASLANPFDAKSSSSGSLDGMNAAPMAIRIDDTSITVAYDRGVARWACRGWSPPATTEPPLSISFDTVPALRAQQTSMIRVAVSGGSTRPIVASLLIGGQSASYATLSDTIEFSPTAPGSIMLEVRADDGIEQAASKTSVEVAP
jgi:hypothetical protein